MNTMKKTGALYLALVLLLTLCTPAAAAAQSAKQAQEETARAVLTAVPAPRVGSIGGEWAVLGLARGESPVPEDYWQNYYRAVEQKARETKGVLHRKKYTEYARVSLALTAIGADARHVAGYDLLRPLGDFEAVMAQGVNGAVWALIALDAKGTMLSDAPDIREQYLNVIFSRQLADGGWALSGTKGDPDLTAMALQALAPYEQKDSRAKAAVERGLACLSRMQDAGGAFPTCEGTAQAVVALHTLGRSPEDSRFVKNGKTFLDGLLGYRLSDGRFAHAKGGAANQMATEQALYALVSAVRAEEGKSPLYQMQDVKPRDFSGGSAPQRHPDVVKNPVKFPGKTFPDIAAHPDRAAIEALAQRGIIEGKSGGVFDPDAQMTRAEFTAITVRALGLVPRPVDAFTDVKNTSWYAGSVGTASTYEIVNGVGAGKFAPLGTITRQEAAVMVARAAELCGLDTGRTETQIADTLSQFGDGRTVAGWARGGVAFCYDAGILDEADLNIIPRQPITRAEIASMLYALLGAAELL